MFIHMSQLYDGKRILKNTDDLLADKFCNRPDCVYRANF